MSHVEIAAAAAGATYVAPLSGGWVSVYPQAEQLGDSTLAQRLSRELQKPCVAFFCFDSDVAVAALAIDGTVTSEITVADPELYDEQIGEPMPGQRINQETADLAITGDVTPWTTAV